MVQQSEIVSLLMAGALVPMIYMGIRRIRLPGRDAIAAGAALMLLSYVFTVAESWFLPDALNTLEHACLAAAGVAFGIGIVKLSRHDRGSVE